MITVAIYFRSFHPLAGCFNDQLCPNISFDTITTTSPLIIHNAILDPCRLSSVAFRSIINQETDIVNFYIVMQLSEKYVMKEDKFLIKDVIFENFNSWMWNIYT